jgi:hypothetical protein
MSENTGNSLSASAAIMSPIVANIDYPVLKKLGKQNIRKFLTERHSYVRDIEERTTQGNGIVGRPVSLTFSVDPSALASLVELGQFGPAVQTVASITDNVLLNYPSFLGVYASNVKVDEIHPRMQGVPNPGTT